MAEFIKLKIREPRLNNPERIIHRTINPKCIEYYDFIDGETIIYFISGVSMVCVENLDDYMVEAND
jgi:hypothetical protein